MCCTRFIKTADMASILTVYRTISQGRDASWYRTMESGTKSNSAMPHLCQDTIGHVHLPLTKHSLPLKALLLIYILL